MTTEPQTIEEVRRSQRGRTPPWNADAEESLLGAMLLSRDAIRVAVEYEVGPEDFYKPAHGHVFSAILAVADRDESADPVTVSEELARRDLLDLIGGRQALMRLQAETPASATATAYSRIVIEASRHRQAIGLAGDLIEAGYNADDDAIDAIARRAQGLLTPRSGRHVTVYDLADLWTLAERERDDPSKPWAIPGMLRTSEVAAFTGSEGLGKSTFLRQIGVCVASGIHPFTGLGFGVERQSVLYVDLQEDEVDMADEMLKLRHSVEGKYEPGWYHAVSLIEGIDLLSGRGQHLLEGLLARYRPALVLMGPVNSMFRTPEGRSRYGEDVIEELRAVMVGMMARYEFALILEGHAGNERSHDEDWRIRGSSVWRSWPAFSLGLKEIAKDPREVDVIRARRDRYDGRVWPWKLYQKEGHKRPWVVSNADYAAILRHQGLHHLLGEAEAMTLDTGEEPF